jgi:hypothetical protein
MKKHLTFHIFFAFLFLIGAIHAQRAKISFIVLPQKTKVSVDGKFYRLGSWNEFSNGKHLVHFEAENYLPMDTIFYFKDGEIRRIKLTMVYEPTYIKNYQARRYVAYRSIARISTLALSSTILTGAALYLNSELKLNHLQKIANDQKYSLSHSVWYPYLSNYRQDFNSTRTQYNDIAYRMNRRNLILGITSAAIFSVGLGSILRCHKIGKPKHLLKSSNSNTNVQLGLGNICTNSFSLTINF